MANYSFMKRIKLHSPTVDCYQAETRHEKMPASYPGAMLFYCSRAFAWDAWINFPFFLPRVPSHVYKPKRLGTGQRKRDHVLTSDFTCMILLQCFHFQGNFLF